MATGVPQEVNLGNSVFRDVQYDREGLSLELGIPIENANSYPVTVAHINYTAYLDGHPVYSGALSAGRTVEPGETIMVTRGVRVDPGDPGELEAAVGGEKTYLEIRGSVVVDGDSKRSTLSFSRRERLN